MKDKITPERFITLSREYVDDVMGDRKIQIKKEHYYIFAISNFIATKEFFLKKRIKKEGKKEVTTVIFDITNNKNILSMITAFYKSIKGKNKNLQEPSLVDVKKLIIIEPEDKYDDEEYRALYLFHNIRNALSHSGKHEIKNNIVTIEDINSNIIDIPIELFDFIAFYINFYVNDSQKNSYVDNDEEADKILQNYLIYKQSRDNKKYYSFESKTAVNRIVSLLAKTKIRIKEQEKTMTKVRGGSNSFGLEEYSNELLGELKDVLNDRAEEVIDTIINANISEEQKLELLTQLNITFRASKRITGAKIDTCIENIESLLKLNKKSAALYSHSIILFTNRKEPGNTNIQAITDGTRKIMIKGILSINIEDLDNKSDEEKKIIIEKYQHETEKLLQELPNLVRIDEHKYRNAIFHNNVKFENERIYFWDQKDNYDVNAIRTNLIDKSPREYNSELKIIEDSTQSASEISIKELFTILCYYHGKELAEKVMSKLWLINQFDKDLLRWDITINDFLYNLAKKAKELSPESR